MSFYKSIFGVFWYRYELYTGTESGNGKLFIGVCVSLIYPVTIIHLSHICQLCCFTAFQLHFSPLPLCVLAIVCVGANCRYVCITAALDNSNKAFAIAVLLLLLLVE